MVMSKEKEEKTVLLSARIDRQLQRQMLHHCIDRGIKIQHFVENAIKEKLTKDEK